MVLHAAPFIVGTGRCGTTLLRLMLDAHPELAIPPETHFLPAVLARRWRLRPRRAFLNAVTGAPFWEDHQIERDMLEARINGLRPFDVSEALRNFYLLYAGRRGKSRWGDKTPYYLLHMRDIQRALPESRFIHLIRDGRDVALSFEKLWFGPNSAREAAERWVSWIELARLQAPALTGYLEVRFEDLVLHTEQTVKKICEFIDLPWTPVMLDYHLFAEERLNEMTQTLHVSDKVVVRAAERKAIQKLTTQPPQPERINSWKTVMKSSDRREFEQIAGRLLRELGYEV